MTGAPDNAPRNCGSVKKVGSLPALAALAPKDWVKRTDGLETITFDITSTAALSVDIRDFVPKGSDLPLIGIDIRGVVPGLSGGGGRSVSIRPGTTFRIRFAKRPFPPISSSAPLVTFEAPCRAACGERERRCVEDDICYATGGEYCKECSHESPERCACVAPDGSDQPDGTSCSFFLSDLPASGRCWSGRCELRPRPRST